MTNAAATGAQTMTTKLAANPIAVIPGSVTVDNTSQSVYYVELLRLEQGDKLRISIRANAYRDQSSADIERWDGSQWRQVFHLNGGAMFTAVEGMYVRAEYKQPIRGSFNGRTFQDFAQDRAYLITRAQEVLA
jgi:hypothetical protein